MDIASVERSCELDGLCQLNDLFFFKNLDHVYEMVSRGVTRLVHGLNVIGKNDYDTPWGEYARSSIAADSQVLSQAQPLRFVHSVPLAPGSVALLIAKKSPVYNKIGQSLGILGYAQIVPTVGFKNPIQQLSEYDFSLTNLSDYKSAQYILADCNDLFLNPKRLTKTEMIVLFYTIRGGSAKTIAARLFVAARTIEVHIEHIKQKFNCASKPAVISYAIEHEYLKLIPSNMVVQDLKTIKIRGI